MKGRKTARAFDFVVFCLSGGPVGCRGKGDVGYMVEGYRDITKTIPIIISKLR